MQMLNDCTMLSQFIRSSQPPPQREMLLSSEADVFSSKPHVKVVRDPCQKITLLLLKSKSVRVIVPESCF